MAFSWLIRKEEKSEGSVNIFLIKLNRQSDSVLVRWCGGAMVGRWNGEIGEWCGGAMVKRRSVNQSFSHSVNDSITHSLNHSFIHSGLKHHPEIFTAIDFNTHWLFEPYMAEIGILVKGGK